MADDIIIPDDPTVAGDETNETSERDASEPLPRLLKVPGGIPDLDVVLREVHPEIADDEGAFQLSVAIDAVTPKKPGYYRQVRKLRWTLELTLEQSLDYWKALDAFNRLWVAEQQAQSR